MTTSPAIGAHTASDVYVKEINLSAVPLEQELAADVIVAGADQGPLTPTLITTYSGLTALYGKSNPRKSYLHLCVRDYFRAGGTSLYVRRAVSDATAYAGVLLQNIGTTANNRVLGLVGYGTTNPQGIDFASAGAANDVNDNLAYLYSIGPGAFYNRYAIGISSGNIRTPQNVALTQSASGGFLPTGNYYYRVTAVGSLGETAATTAVNVTVSSGTANSIAVSWDAVPSARSYRIYGRLNTGAMGLIGTVAAPIVTFTDDGSVIPDSAPPSTATYTPTDTFSVNVYDTAESLVNPIESMPVTLQTARDGYDQQTELAQTINLSSQYIRAISNFDNLTEAAPAIYPIAQTLFSGGTDGTEVTSSNVMAAWDDFRDTDLYNIGRLINCGYTDSSVHAKLVNLSIDRGDCVAFLDTPVSYQQAAAAANYRLLVLGSDTDRACIFSPDLYETDSDTSQRLYVPPSGWAAGLASNADNTGGAGRSMAGPTFGITQEILGLRYNYNGDDRDLLASASVNYFRSRNGIGVYLAEQRTLTKQLSAVSWYPVRRLFDVMERSMATGLLYYLQFPNIERTVEKIGSMLEDYLSKRLGSGAINGYKVYINNAPAVRAQGKLNVYAAIEPSLPINQIGLLTLIAPQGANFEEILGSYTNQ